MELLYLIDRTVTEVLQYFSRRIEKWFRIKPKILSYIIFFLLVINVPFIPGIPEGGLMVIPISAGLYYGFKLFMEPFVAEQLITIQLFFDPEYIHRDPAYEPNHLAWASILIGISYTILGFRLGMEHVSLSFVFTGSLAFSHGLWHFFVRHRTHKNQDKEPVSEALKKLLARCRSWLPMPTPTPG